MEETFTCSICAKRFGNKKSQTRHISYCRRTRSRVRSRKKACLICTKAKTHCDLTYPSCSRCKAKNLTCDYPKASVAPPPPPPPHSSPPQLSTDHAAGLSLSPAATAALDFAAQLTTYEDTDTSYHPLQSSDISSTELASSGSSDCERRNLDCTESNSGYTGGATAQNAIQSYTPPATSRLPYSEPSSSYIDFSNVEIVDDLLLDQIAPKAPKAFLPRRVLQQGRGNQFSLNTQYVLCTLRSYPYMILPGETLPPFIHPQCSNDISKEDRANHKSLPRPLQNCAAIVQMFSVRNESNAMFIWKTIRMEQETILAECWQYDISNAVAALQAITVYMLLRLSEDNDEATNFDIPLIYTMIKVSIHIINKGILPEDNMPSWKDFILVESFRRTSIVLCFIDLLFDITSSLPSYKCDGSMLASIKLPCARNLWKATTSAEWNQAYAARGGGTGTGKQQKLTYGDLLEFRSRRDYTLDSWLSQLDDFGTLVMAATSLSV